MDTAKEVHRSLRHGAGILKYCQDEWVPKLIESSTPGSDCDPRVQTAYLNQATAEAQEGKFYFGFLKLSHVILFYNLSLFNQFLFLVSLNYSFYS